MKIITKFHVLDSRLSVMSVGDVRLVVLIIVRWQYFEVLLWTVVFWHYT